MTIGCKRALGDDRALEAFENVVLSFLLRCDPPEPLSGAAASVVGTPVKYVMGQ
jgi:hypothetical protein